MSFSLACLVVASTAVAQRTWIVDVAKGNGWDFADIPSAVAAASSGDIVVVRTGKYVAPVTITKGLALLGGPSVLIAGALMITSLAAGDRVVIKDVAMTEPPSPPNGNMYGGAHAISCADCVGSVHFDNVKGGGSMHGPGLSVTNCRNVSAARSSLSAGATTIWIFPYSSYSSRRPIPEWSRIAAQFCSWAARCGEP